MFMPKSSLMAYEYYSCSQMVTKQSIKVVMVCIMEKSLQVALSDMEYDILNTMRQLVCKSQILDDQMEKVDTLVVDDS